MGYFYSHAWRGEYRNISAQQRWDLLFVHCSSVAQYVQHVRNVPKLLDFGDMDSQKWIEYANYKPMPLSWGYRLEGAKMKMAEKRLAQRFDLCTATTRAEWQTLEGYGTGAVTDWFPNGVDSEFFSPANEAYDADTISFIGRMDYYPNQECMSRFCRQMWPLLRAASAEFETADRRRRSVGGDAPARRPARRHGHRFCCQMFGRTCAGPR